MNLGITDIVINRVISSACVATLYFKEVAACDIVIPYKQFYNGSHYLTQTGLICIDILNCAKENVRAHVNYYNLYVIR